MKTPVEVKKRKKKEFQKDFTKSLFENWLLFKEGMICQKIAEKKEIILS